MWVWEAGGGWQGERLAARLPRGWKEGGSRRDEAQFFLPGPGGG
jgi:hypothetical protein